MATENRSGAPAEQAVRDAVGQLHEALAKLDGSAGIVSAYLPDGEVFDGFAGGGATGLVESFADVVLRVKECLKESAPDKDVDRVLREAFEAAIGK